MILRWSCPPTRWAAPWPMCRGCAAALRHRSVRRHGAADRPSAWATARGYAREVAAYTHGLGRWAVLPAGYDACHNADEIVSAAGMARRG